jgi:flagellar hook protein FlgE
VLGAIYIGLSGLDAYSQGLEEISNNITNLNTAGFKTSIVSFSDMVGMPGRGGLDYSSGGWAGGRGVDANQPQLDFQQGTMQQTGRDLDMAVDGTGFLVLLDGDRLSYTRTGSFEVDPDGYIVLSGTNHRLAVLDSENHPAAVSVNAFQTSPPQATTTVTLADNLSSTATSYDMSDLTVYDANGTAHQWKVHFAKATGTDADPNSWTVTVTDGDGTTVGSQTLKFVGGAVDPATEKLTFTDANAGLSVGFDFSNGVTSYSSGDVSTLRSAAVDGYGVGSVTSLTINVDGHLEIGYSNEQKKDLGAIAIADFRDPGALIQQGAGVFTYKGSLRDLMASGDARVGKIVSGEIEGSNVDLSKEFGELILIQRGFQASSQVISVSNDMIQQLFGIRGQG